jgi:hypothetical protein
VLGHGAERWRYVEVYVKKEVCLIVSLFLFFACVDALGF